MLKPNEVLVESSDHGYRIAHVIERKVVFNTKYKTFSEYVGDEYLEENEIVEVHNVIE